MSPDIGRGEKLIEDVTKDACARLYSIVIDNDDKVSTEDNKQESNKAGEIAIRSTQLVAITHA
jgi:hypothetical protein